MIKVLLVDEHTVARQSLSRVLCAYDDIQVVADAAEGHEALPLIRQWMDPTDGGPHLDAILLDIALPGRNGLLALKQIKAAYPGLPVLMLSTYPDRQFALRCLRAGACHYLHKHTAPDELALALRRAVHAGASPRPLDQHC